MNNERAVAAFCVAIVIGIVLALAAERTVPAPADLSQKVNQLQHELDDEKKEISDLTAESTIKAKIGGQTSPDVSTYLVDLQKKLDDQRTDEFGKSSFWATTYLAWFAFVATFLIVMASVVVAFRQLIDINGTARKIAREEVDELNNILTGRLQLVISVILRRITWDAKYNLRSETFDFGQEALRAGKRASEFCDRITRKEYDNLKAFALNNLVFYTTLTTPRDQIDRKYADA